jgi:hypothetical protein
MSFFGKDKTKEETTVAEETTVTEEDMDNCANCEKEFKSSDLNDDSQCSDCAKLAEEEEKMKKENKAKLKYDFIIEYRADGDGNTEDNNENTKISKEDAEICYRNLKTALDSGKEFVEFPEMQSLNDDDEPSTIDKTCEYIGAVQRFYVQENPDYEEEDEE